MLWIVWLFRQCFTCKRWIMKTLFRPEDEERSYFVPVTKLPWLYIGAKEFDGTIDCTEDVNSMVTYGLRVDEEWLDLVTERTPMSWIYLDSKTLEEKEFPSEGFVIEDDTVEQDPQDQNESANTNEDHTE